MSAGAESLWALLELGPIDESAWMSAALCAQTDPDAFFPDTGGSTTEAKRVCLVCPVRRECRDHAIDNPELVGVWGGLSECERRQRRRESTEKEAA